MTAHGVIGMEWDDVITRRMNGRRMEGEQENEISNLAFKEWNVKLWNLPHSTSWLKKRKEWLMLWFRFKFCFEYIISCSIKNYYF